MSVEYMFCKVWFYKWLCECFYMFSISCFEESTWLTNIVFGTVITHNTKREKHTSTGVYKLKCNDCPKYYIGQTGRSFKTWYTEQIKALTQLLMKSNFAEHILNTHHTYTDIKTNLEILHILSEGPKLNTSKQYEIYKHYKQSPTNVLNDQIHYKSHKLFDTIKHSSHNNISAILKTMNRNIAASSTWTVKHWKRCTWHRKASAKISSKMKKFLHSEMNQLIQHITVQDQDGQNNISYFIHVIKEEMFLTVMIWPTCWIHLKIWS